MRLGWKIFLPFTLLWVVLMAGVLLTFDALPGQAKAISPLGNIAEVLEETASEVGEGVDNIIEIIEEPPQKGQEKMKDRFARVFFS